MKLKTLMIPLGILILAFTSCSTIPDSIGAAEDFSWEAAEQLKGKDNLILALAELETNEIPPRLYNLFRDDLSTALVTAFREEGINIKVVTRDKVDRIVKEQSLQLQGMTYKDAQLQVGMLLGADLLVTGTLAWLEGDIFRFSGQIIEVHTGTLAGGYSTEFWFDMELAE